MRVRWLQPAQETLNRGQSMNVRYGGRSVQERKQDMWSPIEEEMRSGEAVT